MSSTRRDFLKQNMLVSIGFLGLNSFACNSFATMSGEVYGFGPLRDSSNGILRLPEGFMCTVLSRTGDKMDDGLLSPGNHDGMGVFKWSNGKVLLIRNHELTPGAAQLGPFGKNNELLTEARKQFVYDLAKGQQTCVGGTTTMLYDEAKQKVELHYLSLIGTVRNCAGGITPWNSWLTCEETSLNVGGVNGTLEKDHGYNFEVPASAKIGITEPVPLKAMGRFVHEAVAVQPGTGIVYQTEDSPDSVFYRFIPNEPGKLEKGGKLQCLAIPEWPSADTRNWERLNSEKFPQKKTFNVSWIDLDNVEAPDNDLRLRGFQKGAARFSNTEGIWYGKDELYFACTSGGYNGKGQVFRYKPSPFEGTAEEKNSPAKIELFLEPNDTDTFQSCDNLTISPWGDVIICEDKQDPRIIGITPEGNTYEIAKNIGYRTSEFAGPVFSPSGRTLFINIQTPGLTLAITGPWQSVQNKKS